MLNDKLKLILYFERMTKQFSINSENKKNDYLEFSDKLWKLGFKRRSKQTWYKNVSNLKEENIFKIIETIKISRPEYYELDFSFENGDLKNYSKKKFRKSW